MADPTVTDYAQGTVGILETAKNLKPIAEKRARRPQTAKTNIEKRQTTIAGMPMPLGK